MKLSAAITIYAQKKRVAGCAFKQGERALMTFCRSMKDPPISALTAQAIVDYLNSRHSCSIQSWRSKYSLLRHLFEHWAARGAITPLHLPPLRTIVSRTFVPYIYSCSDIRQLLRMTNVSQKKSQTLDGDTFRTLLLFLYATGAYLGETIALKRKDLNFKTKEVSLAGNGFSQNRCIPISHDLAMILRNYLRNRRGTKAADSPLFTRKDGSSLVIGSVALMFAKLRTLAGIARNDGAIYAPRMHDLRSTFAVHRITSWIKQGQDLNRMMPALSAYMGQLELLSTERYLFLTPERFRRELNKLSPQKSKKKWRNNPVLMTFLSKL